MEEMREFDTFVTTASDGTEIEMAIIDEFALEDDTYVVAAKIIGDTVDNEGVYLFELKEKEDGVEVVKIKNQFTYDKVSRAYMEMEEEE